MTAWLLIVAIACNFLPAIIADITGHSLAAWFFVADNLQLACLWWVAAVLFERLADRDHALSAYKMPTLAVCAYGVFEAIQNPICRLVFPMNAPPPKHADGICAAAGMPTYDLSPLLIALCAVALASTLAKLPGRQKTRIG